VLAALLTGAELTHLDCWERFGSSRLAHHAFILRGAGWPIQTVERPVPTSDGRQAIIAFYRLPKATIDQAGEAGAGIAAVAAARGGHDFRPRHRKASALAQSRSDGPSGQPFVTARLQVRQAGDFVAVFVRPPIPPLCARCWRPSLAQR
jgi:hypothetical protein